MTWQRTLNIGSNGARVAVVDAYVEVDLPAGDRLTPEHAALLAGAIKQAARWIEREAELGSTRRRAS